MHGGHQGAKKSIKTGSPLVMISGKSPVARVRRVRACTDSRANAATSCIRSLFLSINNDSRKQRYEGPKNKRVLLQIPGGKRAQSARLYRQSRKCRNILH
jgi:hypothetical protein